MKGKTGIIKAVTFDLWETLLFEKNGASSQRMAARCSNLSRALRDFRIRVSPAQIDSALKRTISSLVNMWDANKDVTHADQLRMIFKFATDSAIAFKEDWIDRLSAAYTTPIFEVPPYLNPDARKALSSLRDRKNLIGLICNTGLTPGFALRKLLFKEEVGNYFDLMVFSDEAGIRKPDSRIFDLAARNLNVRPSEVVHVGDNLKTDVWGAKNAGWRAIHFASEEGRDRPAESDPTSLVALSRNLGSMSVDQIEPDRVIARLVAAVEAVEEIDVNGRWLRYWTHRSRKKRMKNQSVSFRFSL